MSWNFLRLLALSAMLLALVGCGSSADSSREQYIQECSNNAGRDHCECVWKWFERHAGDRRDDELLRRADAECLRKDDNSYVEGCHATGRTRLYCRCVWRWFLRHVTRDRAKEINAAALADPRFESRETRGAERACR